MKKYAWIFDLDGTLVDSIGQIGYALNVAREDFGYKKLQSKKIEELVGLPIQHFLSDLPLDKCDFDEIVIHFRRILEVEINKDNLIFPGVELFLTKLKSKGHKLAIATSKPTYLANLVIENSSLNELFDVIQGTDGFPAKPDPTCVQLAMEALGTSNAIMVGDRVEDILAATAAGIDSIGIANSFHGIQSLENAGAKYAFSSFLDFTNSYEIIDLLID